MQYTPKKRLRLGFIGSGGMADVHLQGLSNSELFPDVELCAFCDIILDRAKAQAYQYGAHAYSSPSQMIAEEGLDACYILLPPFAHGDAERACLEGDVPFLVEKPIGLDAIMLEEIHQEVQIRGLITAAGYMNRYQPSVQAAKAAFDEDRAVLAYGGWLSGPPTTSNEYFSSNLIGQWWVNKEKSGGQMVEQVTHTIDLVRYFLGDAVEVYAQATQAFNKSLPDLLPGYTMDDAMTTAIRFESGALATIMSSSATPNGKLFLSVLGMKTTADFKGWGHDVVLLQEGSEPRSFASEGSIFAKEDRAFLDAIKTGDSSLILTDYADAYKTALLTLGANQSALTGKPVGISLGD